MLTTHHDPQFYYFNSRGTYTGTSCMSYQITYVNDDNILLGACVPANSKTEALSILSEDIPYLKYRPFNIKHITKVN